MVAGLALKLKESDIALKEIGRFSTAVATGYVKLGRGQLEKLNQKLISGIKGKIKVRKL